MVRVILLALVMGVVSCASDSSDPKPASQPQNPIIGTYFGLLPCADCRGIETNIVLDKNGHYEESVSYLGKSKDTLYNSGTWKIDDSQLILTHSGKVNRYLIGNQKITKLSPAGKVIEGDLAKKYELQKKN